MILSIIEFVTCNGAHELIWHNELHVNISTILLLLPTGKYPHYSAAIITVCSLVDVIIQIIQALEALRARDDWRLNRPRKIYQPHRFFDRSNKAFLRIVHGGPVMVRIGASSGDITRTCLHFAKLGLR